jgi:hypothetical protein
MDTSQLTVAVLMYFVLPVWLAAGFADYLCHRASNIATTSGPKKGEAIDKNLSDRARKQASYPAWSSAETF